MSEKRHFRVVALFAGIGGIERGLERAGHETVSFCEIDEAAVEVLSERFPGVPIERDVAKLEDLPAGADLLTAGFPCQDLSQAGETKGIYGKKSGLVENVFRLLEKRQVPWLLLENVPFMLQLGKGEAMRYIISELERLGYRWAYRVVDSRSFGLPQRRERVYLLASLEGNPETLLLVDEAGIPVPLGDNSKPCGFYWTEGLRGLGWGVDCVPTLKGGSGLGIPSPPAIWLPGGEWEVVTPDIRDAERLQGFPAGWTEPALKSARAGHRWKLAGNAVTVDAAEWLGQLIAGQERTVTAHIEPMSDKGSCPRAAYGSREGRYSVRISAFPKANRWTPLAQFLQYPLRPLSKKASSGFWNRLTRSTLRRPQEFDRSLLRHIDRMDELDRLGNEAPLASMAG